jgi:hypothetical protein
MKKRSNISKYFSALASVLLLGTLAAQVQIGFVPYNTNEYYKAFSEGTDGTIYLAVSNVTFETTITFYVRVHLTAPEYGTANLSSNDHGNAHLDDFNRLYWNDAASGSPNSTSNMVVTIFSNCYLYYHI